MTAFVVFILTALAVSFGIRHSLPPEQAVLVMQGYAFFVLAVAACWIYILKARDLSPFDIDSRLGDPGMIGCADPWAMQYALMAASEQDMPSMPTLSNTSALYAALIMEETAETYAALATAVTSFSRYAAHHENRAKACELADRLRVTAEALEMQSKAIRGMLQGWEFRMPLDEKDALAIFDGTTDVAVVNCGFALASGLDGATGYMEVADSNLSKRNPETLKIDKTRDGKWIKGRNYREPDLLRVLRMTAAHRARN